MRILLVGGGSGGHVYPLIAVARALRTKAEREGIALELMLWGDGEFIERAAKENNLPFRKLIAGKWRRYFSIWNFVDILKTIFGFFQSLWMMYWYMPDAVFAKGGYAAFSPAIVGSIYSVPLSLISRLYHIPIYIHESDSVPGLANNFLQKMASVIFISFESSSQYFKGDKTILVGNPVRESLAGGSKEKALKYFNLNPAKHTVLIIGGSQGAKRINDLILGGLAQMTKEFQLIHQSGDGQYQDLKMEVERYEKEGIGTYGNLILENYRLSPFLNEDELKLAYAAADVVVARAGSGLIFEIALVGKPAIVIPLSGSAKDHQLTNAIEFSKYGALMVEDELNLTPLVLFEQIKSLLDPVNHESLCSKIKTFAKPDAAEKIAQTILDYKIKS